MRKACVIFTGSSTDAIYRSSRISPNRWWKDSEKNWRVFRWSLLLLAVILVTGLVIYFLMIDMQVMAPVLKESSNVKTAETQWTTESSGTAVDDVVSLDGDVILDLGGVAYNEGELHIKPEQDTHQFPDTATSQQDSSRLDFIEIVPAPNLGTSAVANESEEYVKPLKTETEDLNQLAANIFNETQLSEISSDIDNDFLLATSQLLNKIRKTVQFSQSSSKTEDGNNSPYDTQSTTGDFQKYTASPKVFNTNRVNDIVTSRNPVFPTLPTTSTKIITIDGTVSHNYNESDGLCFSPRLGICQGILPYDLTTLPLVPGIDKVTDLDAALPYFEMILESGCSDRAQQFICSLLEPACQPMGNKILLPCRKACKVVAEECNDFILSTLDLSRVFQCDLYPDSDENSQCVNFAKGDSCFGNEFQCPDGTCIPERWLCDGISNCNFEADESNCTHCNKGEIKCETNQKCIPQQWKCDGYKDCDDGSDEVSCTSGKDEMMAAKPYRSTCTANELRCVDGRCITLQQLCDGTRDCSDGIDEASCSVSG